MTTYRSGKLAAAFLVIPKLTQWKEILTDTKINKKVEKENINKDKKLNTK